MSDRLICKSFAISHNVNLCASHLLGVHRCSRTRTSPPASGADPEKLQLVCHFAKVVGGGNPRFNFPRETFFDFNHLRAPRANQVMMMSVVALADEFKPGRAVPEIEPFDHLHFFEHVERAVNGGQVALAFWHGAKDFPAGERVGMFAQQLQNRLARAGDSPRLPAQASGQGGQFLPPGGMRMGVFLHVTNRVQPVGSIAS